MTSVSLEWGEGDAARVAEYCCILRTVVGSQVHGLANPGTDDRDEMAIFIEPPEYAIGLNSLQHWVHRTQPEGMPSGPGDLDLIAHSLRKFCRLAMKGSPTVLLPLFAPEDQVLVSTEAGRQLREHRGMFVGEHVREAFLGYLRSQQVALVGGKRVRARERSTEHGYDTKYAMHALRVGYQGIELIKTGDLTLPVPEPQRSRLMDVRNGRVSLADVVDELDEVRRELEGVRPDVEVIPSPNLGVESWLIEAYLEDWRDWRPPVFI